MNADIIFAYTAHRIMKYQVSIITITLNNWTFLEANKTLIRGYVARQSHLPGKLRL